MTIKTYDILKGGARARLNTLRSKAEKMNTETIKLRSGELRNRYRDAGTYTWRNVRWTTLKADTSRNWRSVGKNGRYIVMNISAVEGLRDVGHADEVIRLNHRGWFADAHQDDTYRGHVWQLPARNGEPAYICGYADEDGGAVILSASNGQLDVTSEKEDAARWADGLAERNARRDCEYSEADQKLQAALDTVAEHKAEAGQIIRALRDQKAVGPLAGTLCTMLLEEFSSARRQFHKALAELAEAREHMASVERYA